MRDTSPLSEFAALDLMVEEVKRRLQALQAPLSASIDELSADLRIATYHGDPVEVAMAALRLFILGARVSRMPPTPTLTPAIGEINRLISVGMEIEAEREARRGKDRRGGSRPGTVDRRASARRPHQDGTSESTGGPATSPHDR